RRLNELDQAATTGKIPPALLRRWEHAMEDVSLWRFNPSVVHGDLHEDNLLVEAGRVTAVTGWTDLRIGDPADDFAWLVASNEQDFVDAVLKAYTGSRRDAPDQHLLRRAALSAEFALAQYLVKGLAAGDNAMVAEAEGMLQSLAADIAEFGGQPISVEPLPPAGTQGGSGQSHPAGSPSSGTAPASAGAPAASAGTTANGRPAAGGSSAVTPAVTVAPVPVQPAVTVVPVPVQPAVHVAPIGAEPQATSGAGAGEDGPAGGQEPEAKGGPDDTSTAALSVINIKQG
ncbi:MAG: phosphotransferase, partial [Pseudarthrobacter sp.]|nr:phosphotransferase [Pseudarthrobacter sp.]